MTCLDLDLILSTIASGKRILIYTHRDQNRSIVEALLTRGTELGVNDLRGRIADPRVEHRASGGVATLRNSTDGMRGHTADYVYLDCRPATLAVLRTCESVLASTNGELLTTGAHQRRR